MLSPKIIICFLLFVFAKSSVGQVICIPGEIDAEIVKTDGSVMLEGPSVLKNDGYFVWGGSVIKGDDGKYHMLYSRWPAGPDRPQFSNGWLFGSEIAYAVSDFPDRDFQFVKVVLQGRMHKGSPDSWDAQGVHNPHIKKFNGNYYLYYIGSKDPGKQPVGSKGEKVDKRNRIQQNQKIGVIGFDNFDDLIAGKFERPLKPLLSPRTRVKPDYIVNPSPDGTTPKPDNIIVVNPSVVYRSSDSKYLLYFKGNFWDPGWRGVHGVAIADSPTGPFVPTDNFVFDIKTTDGKIASAEDPYVWYYKQHQKFHAVFKDFTGTITGNKPGLAILTSADGISWQLPEKPFFMKKQLILKGEGILKVHRLERPQLLIADDGTPLVLYAGCAVNAVNSKKDGSSFNVQIKLHSIID